MNGSAETALRFVGTSVGKMDSPGLAAGIPAFTDDLAPQGCLVMRVLRSPHAHGIIRSIDVADALAVPGIAAILTHADTPRIPFTTAGQSYPEPSPYDTFILDRKVRFVGDRVAIVVGETREAVDAAMKLVKVDYEILPHQLSPEESLAPSAAIIHDQPEWTFPVPAEHDRLHNVAARVSVSLGDLGETFAPTPDAKVFSGKYFVHRTSHCAREPHCAAAWLDLNGRLVIMTSTQVPWHVRRIVARALGLKETGIRVIKPRVGGAFGGKQEIILEDALALAVLKTGRPVKVVLDREEVFIGTRTRHPQRVELKSMVGLDGVIRGLDMSATVDAGAYGTHSLTVACNTGSRTLGLFPRVEAVRFQASAVYTNLPPSGAFRGYGAMQGYAALGILVDEMARDLGIDVLDLYRLNCAVTGDRPGIMEQLGEGRPGSPVVIRSAGLLEAIDRGAEAIGWNQRKSGVSADGKTARGMGAACMLQGSGVPFEDMGSVTLTLNEDGGFTILCGATDLGTGSDTMMVQIAAEVLGVPPDCFALLSSDTDSTPYDVGAFASSTTYVSGNACKLASEGMAEKIRDLAARVFEEPPESIRVADGMAVSSSGPSLSYADLGRESLYGHHKAPLTATASYFGEGSPPPFSAHFAEVEVCLETGIVRVLRYVSAVDCGTVVNPALARTQTEGGVLIAIGQALTEGYAFDSSGRMLNPGFDRYKIPGPTEIPEFTTIFVKTEEPTGPFGAKSVSEVCMNGPVPAISNAIFDAVGVRLKVTPFTPDKVLKSIDSAGK